MMPYVNLILLALLVVLQTTLMPAAALDSTKPFLPLLAVVCWGMLRGPVPGVWWALAAGLLLDLVSPIPTLFYTLPLLVAAAVVAGGRGRLFPSNVLTPWLMTAIATVAFVVVQHALIPLTGGLAGWSAGQLGREVVPQVALNLLWLPVLYFPLRALARRVAGPRIEWEA